MIDWLPEHLVPQLTWLAGLVGGAWLTYFVTREGLVAIIRRVVKRSTVTWDDALVDASLFARMAHVAPALILYYGIQFVPDLADNVTLLVQRVSIALIVVVTARTISAFLTAVNLIYSRNPEYRHRPIKGYIQMVKLFIAVLTILIVVSILLDKSPWLFLSGLGAMTAVLLLVFRDTILSLVASVQIASNDMIHVGDWIEMPQAGADGDVIDVALHTVKVQNWDKTITTIPTHKFIDESFKNWRGMTQSGGRRIKRSLAIDMNSIRFLEPNEVERFRSWRLLSSYIEAKETEIWSFNQALEGNGAISADIRRLTNVGTLRAYIEAYLHAHPKIHELGYTLIVRQLAPGPTGLPIELYCFSNDQDWTRYEGIQADIFDHILAMVPEFGLRVFQAPAGSDFERMRAS